MSRCLMPFVLSPFLCITSAWADCAADIKAATEVALAKAPFRLEWSIEMDGDTTKGMGEVVAADRMRLDPYVMTPKGYFAGGNKISELDGDGKVMFSDLRPQVNVGTGPIENAQCVGKTNFEGGDFLTYKFRTEAALLGMMGTSDVEFYVGDDGLPVWLVMNTKVPGVGEAKRTAKYSFDAGIVIADP